MREDVVVERRQLLGAIHCPPDGRSLQILSRVEEAETEITHQPFVGRCSREVHLARTQVDRHTTRGLYDVGVDVGAVRVGETGNCLQIVLEPVDERDHRDRDQLRVSVHQGREILHVDAALSRHGDADVDPLSLQ